MVWVSVSSSGLHGIGECFLVVSITRGTPILTVHLVLRNP